MVLFDVAELGEVDLVILTRYPRAVWCAIPHHGEKGVSRRVLGPDEVDGLFHGHIRGVSFEFFERTQSAHERVPIEEIRDGKPMVEPEIARVPWILLEDGSAGAHKAAQVPFTEVTGRVTRALHSLGDCPFLKAHGVAVAEHA